MKLLITGADCDKGDNSYRTKNNMDVFIYKSNNGIHCCRKKKLKFNTVFKIGETIISQIKRRQLMVYQRT